MSGGGFDRVLIGPVLRSHLRVLAGAMAEEWVTDHQTCGMICPTVQLEDVRAFVMAFGCENDRLLIAENPRPLPDEAA